MMNASLKAVIRLQNIAIMLALLVVPYLALGLFHVPEVLRGRIALAAVFLFTGIGHFLKSGEMTQMLPPWVPGRLGIIYLSGVFELACVAALPVSSLHPAIGWVIIVFLLALLPSNVYAAVHRIKFGGHEAGPAYLFVRIPLQLLLVGWTWWFSIKP